MTSPLPAPLARHRIVTASEVRDNDGMAVFLSGQERKGDWAMPRHLRIFCVLGSAVVDLREARISEGISVLEVVVVLGSVELMVPPGIRVEFSVDTLAGSVEFHPDPTVPLDPAAPTIHVVGSTYLGSVEAYARLAGEGGREAKRRIRAFNRADPSRRIGRKVLP